MSIARQVQVHALRALNGDIYWKGPLAIEEGQAAAQPLGPYLYPGTTGVALFLAACERCCGLDGAGELARTALGPLRSELQALRAAGQVEPPVEHLLGGLSGLGSLIYALVRIGDLLDAPELHEDAHFLSSWLSPDAIARDCHNDVMFGIAGALLALLALHERLPGPNLRGETPLAVARCCADRLLTRPVACADGHRSWPNGLSGLPVGGFAHGAAGIAYALLRLHRLSPDKELRQAAVAGITFERSLFVPGRQDWRIAWRDEERFVNTWCNGAPGIALGRIGGAAALIDAAIEREIDCALHWTASRRLDDADHLCCGNLGRVDILVFAARQLRRPDLAAAAAEIAGQVIDRALAVGDFGMMPANGGIFDPRLFLGMPGVGYALLRLVEPDTLPCLLAME